MNDLISWLRQQLDTDERRARRAGGTHPDWSYDRETFTVFAGAHVIAARKAAGSPLNDVDGEHIANNDPDRVLRQVQAHRAILDAYEAEDNADRYGGCGDDCEWKALRYAIKQIVSIYSDRDGYRAEWAS